MFRCFHYVEIVTEFIWELVNEKSFYVHFMFGHDNGKTCLLMQLIHEGFIEYLGF